MKCFNVIPTPASNNCCMAIILKKEKYNAISSLFSDEEITNKTKGPDSNLDKLPANEKADTLKYEVTSMPFPN